jgi:phosphoribosylanthranilate isomerase
MTLLVKICGLRTPEALDAALEAGADMVDFVFLPPSPRHLGFEAAKTLGARVNGRAQKVAPSVGTAIEDLAAAMLVWRRLN